MKQLRIGDIIEIKTNIGLSYSQYTHKHKKYGALIRIFDTIYHERPDIFNDVINDSLRFSIFFPLKAAISKGIFYNICNMPIRNDLKEFPIFRAGFVDPYTKKVNDWWLWDGENEWKIDKLTDEQRKLPIRGIWNDTLLIERIETDWKLELADF